MSPVRSNYSYNEYAAEPIQKPKNFLDNQKNSLTYAYGVVKYS